MCTSGRMQQCNRMLKRKYAGISSMLRSRYEGISSMQRFKFAWVTVFSKGYYAGAEGGAKAEGAEKCRGVQ